MSSVETMVRRAPTSSWTASPNLGQDLRSMARLLNWVFANFWTRIVVVFFTSFPSSSNLYSTTFFTPLSSGPITCRGGNRKSKSFPSSSSSNSSHHWNFFCFGFEFWSGLGSLLNSSIAMVSLCDLSMCLLLLLCKVCMVSNCFISHTNRHRESVAF